jgi:hypothetical protein
MSADRNSRRELWNLLNGKDHCTGAATPTVYRGVSRALLRTSPAVGGGVTTPQ